MTEAELDELDAEAGVDRKKLAEEKAAKDQRASADMVNRLHHATAVMLMNRAEECASTGEWDPSVISNSLKFLNAEGGRAKRDETPLASIDTDILKDIDNFSRVDYNYNYR